MISCFVVVFCLQLLDIITYISFNIRAVPTLLSFLHCMTDSKFGNIFYKLLYALCELAC